MTLIMNSYRKSPMVINFLLIMLKILLFRQFVFQGIQYDRLPADAVSVLVFLCLLELITTARWKPLVFGVLNVVMSFILFASTVYFNYFGSVPTYAALHSINQVGQVRDSVESSIQLKNFLFFIDIVLLGILWLITLRSGSRRTQSKSIAKPLYVLIAAVVCIAVSFVYIRVDRDISNELVQAERLGVLNYQVATAMKESKSGGKRTDTAKALAALQSAYNMEGNEAVKAGSPNYFGIAKGMNVIVIQMEAFQNLVINMKVDGQEVTPVLNRLIDDSFYFPHFFQQIGQGNTSDAEFLSNTGIYPTGSIAMSKGYGDRDIPSMPKLLAKQNYESNTFHPNDVTFWDRDKLYPALGFTKYYDKPYFNDDQFNALGASDKEIYRVALEKLEELHKQEKPFYAQIVTLSSHHPFKVPEDLRSMTLPNSLEGKQLGNYIHALHYTDEAIGQFIDGLKEAGMWDNTVLVLYGDHFGMQTKDNDPEWVKEQLGISYEERISRFNIPFIVHVPGVEGKTITNVGGQVDIMPTIANLMGVSLKKEGYTVFGKDLLNATNNVIGMRYYMPTGSFFNNEIMFVPGKGFEDGTAFDLNTMEPIDDFSQYRDQYDYILELMKLSDEYMKGLPAR